MLVYERMTWISDLVVSVFLDQDENAVIDSPFQGLDLSRISAIGSRPSDTLLPLSPPISPHRQSTSIAHQDHTDSSFLAMEKQGSSEFKMKTDLSSSARTNAIFLSLLRTIMGLFDELVLSGMEDYQEVMNLGRKLGQLMKKKASADVLGALFPSFCRFATLIGKGSSDYGLVIEAIDVFDRTGIREGDGRRILFKTVHTILSNREKYASKHVSFFIRDIDSFIYSLANKMKTESKECVSMKGNRGWTFVLDTILESGNGKFIPLFIQSLLQRSKDCNDDANYKHLLKEILVPSCKKCPGKVEAEVRDILSKILDTKLGNDKGNSMQNENLEVMIEAVLVS